MTTVNPLVVDLSHWDPADDYDAVKEDGIVGVIYKATEGQGYTDPTYVQQQNAAKMAELQLKGQQAQQELQSRMAGNAQDSAANDRERQIQGQMASVESADRAADRASRERVAEMRLQGERVKLQAQQAESEAKRQHEINRDAANTAATANQQQRDQDANAQSQARDHAHQNQLEQQRNLWPRPI